MNLILDFKFKGHKEEARFTGFLNNGAESARRVRWFVEFGGSAI